MECVAKIKGCMGPYSPSGVTCCYECSKFHDEQPNHNCLCDNCKEKYGKLGLMPTGFMVSLSEEFICKVASKAQVTADGVKDYLNSDVQDNNILNAFVYYHIIPINKHYSK